MKFRTRSVSAVFRPINNSRHRLRWIASDIAQIEHDEIVELKFGGLHPVPFERLDRPNQEFLLVELSSRISVGRVPTSFNAALLCLLTQTWKAPAIQRLEFFSEVSGPSVRSSDCFASDSIWTHNSPSFSDFRTPAWRSRTQFICDSSWSCSRVRAVALTSFR